MLPIRLGCSADDRLDPQPVEIDLTIRFETPPRGMVTVRKVSPPTPEITKGAEFTVGD